MGWWKLERRDVDFLYCLKLLLQAVVLVEYNLGSCKVLDCCLEFNTPFPLWFFRYLSTPVDVNNKEMMLKIIKSAINTKAINRWSDLACSIALDAVKTVEFEENGRKEIDIKKYAKVEKVSVSYTYPCAPFLF